jgi:hypothetical protein
MYKNKIKAQITISINNSIKSPNKKVTFIKTKKKSSIVSQHLRTKITTSNDQSEANEI